jgi:peptide/nickel transport system permease protein
MVRVIPGDPAFLILGDRATEETAARLREQLGLNEPLPTQYWMFISGIAAGDLGDSLLYRQPVTQLVMRRVPVSIFLAVYAMALRSLHLTFGILRLFRDRVADHIIRVIPVLRDNAQFLARHLADSSARLQLPLR